MRLIFYTKHDTVFILEYAASVGLLNPGASYLFCRSKEVGISERQLGWKFHEVGQTFGPAVGILHS